MDKKDALKIVPDAIPIKTANTGKIRDIPLFYPDSDASVIDLDSALPNPFTEPAGGGDCLKTGHINLLDGVTLCFFENKLYAIKIDAAGGFGDINRAKLVVHKDYEQTVKNLNFTTSAICDNPNQFPYYMGGMDLGVCNALVAIKTRNISLCAKAARYGYELNACLIEVVEQTGNVGDCQQITKTGFKDDFYHCVSEAAITKNDMAVCDVLQEDKENYLRCIEQVVSTNSRNDLCGQLASIQIKNNKYPLNITEKQATDYCFNLIKLRNY